MDHTQHVETIQIVLDGELLKAADRAAARLKLNRSALFREALRDYLRQARVRERETADRAGYERFPEPNGELAVWDRVAAWPKE